MRSIHGHGYTRLHNADVVTMLREFAVDFRPPQEAQAGGTGLYCGEQDLFCFLIDPTGWAEIEGEAFAPGFYVWNSEVGRRSVGISTFWFQAVCQNHIIWDAIEVTEFARKHTGKVGEALGDIRRIVEALVEKRDARRDGFAAVIRKAMETKLGEDAEEAMKVLAKAGITRNLATRALDIAKTQGRFTIFSVVDALTKTRGGASQRRRSYRGRPEGKLSVRPRQRQLKNDRRSMSTWESEGELEMPRANAKATAAPEPEDGDPADRNRPVHVVRLKNIRAAVWANETEMGTRYNVTVSRLYKGEDQQWGTSESFGRDDLLLLAKVVDLAHSWISEQMQASDVPF